MEDFLYKITDQFKAFFAELSLARKVFLLFLFVGVVALGTSIVIWATKTRYDVLFTNLNKEDATMVARLLEEKKNSLPLF